MPVARGLAIEEVTAEADERLLEPIRRACRLSARCVSVTSRSNSATSNSASNAGSTR
ncbi:MAG TPA: hypothetical protein VFS33_02635 [Gemmatimonadales bacterium]|nr:hypothetical protein [Gemmatimonadales bacterium]